MQSALDSHPRIVDDDDLLLDGLSRPEVVVLAREANGRTTNIGEQGPIVAQEGLTIRGRNPVGSLVSHVKSFVRAIDKVGTETGLLELLPVDRQVLAAPGHAVAELQKCPYSHGEMAETPQVRKCENCP